MEKRTMTRGAWMGMGLVLWLGAMEVGAAGATPAAESKAAKAAESKPPKPTLTPAEQAQKEKIEQIEKVARDFSAKRDSDYVNKAREEEQKRREEEAGKKTLKGAPPESPSQVNPASIQAP